MSDPAPLFGDVLLKLGLVTQGQVQEALALQSLSGQRVGEALISLGYVTREQLQNALQEALGFGGASVVSRPPLGELLVGLKHLTSEQLRTALARQKLDARKLGELLVELGYCSFKQIYEALGLQQRVGGRGAAQALAGDRADGDAQVRVLIVDDSEIACEVVASGLRARGYHVVAFEDPYEALEQVFRLEPSIVLSDLDMPGIDGLELCRRLKEGPARAVPVIILTASDAQADRVTGLRAGADDYVNKSASMDEIAARIESVVRRTGATEKIRKLFARYTSEEVVEEILKAPGGVVLTGEKREATLLFADIRNFTGLAESLEPEVAVDVLNTVLGRLSDAVLTCGGTLDKFLGDGLMAVFGAPVKRPDDALRAVQCARMMMEAMAALRAEARQELSAMQLGIGVNTGFVVAGNLGSALRTEYTCIGDAVNVASRLCAQAGPGEVLVGRRTVELVGQAGRFEALEPVRLKGKAQPVPLFRAI